MIQPAKEQGGDDQGGGGQDDVALHGALGVLGLEGEVFVQQVIHRGAAKPCNGGGNEGLHAEGNAKEHNIRLILKHPEHQKG